jgi:spore germination protein YaaH
VLMAYDECWAASTPGPVAGQDWFELMLQDRLPAAGGRRAIVALGAYAYDWPAGGAASVLSVTDARALAKVHGSEIRRDLATANLTFTYVDEQARSHEVWMTDLVTLNYEREAVTAAGARGWALWRLGLEDPAIWTGAPAAAAAPYSPSPGPLRLPRCFLLPAPPGH